MRVALCFSIPGMDLYADLDFHVTYKGFRGALNEPPEAPDFQVDSISVYEDVTKGPTRDVEFPDWILDAIADSDEAYTAMLDYYSANGSD